MENLSSKTVKELKQYAYENNIDLSGAKTKTRILAILLGMEAEVSQEPTPEQTVITHPEPVKRAPVSNASSSDDGVVISRAASNKGVKKTTETQKVDTSKVALFSEKNVRWSDVGALQKGYNIVTKEAAEKWSKLKGIRKATAEEVATYYGK
jgi:hypothetical protein